jgi:acetolactate synthase-1/2/3 large subunit
MNGAESLVRTLVAGGVTVCFTNPGTSEMHFVAALDKVDGIRCVLGLFEGVVTGAADGYWRMADRPAATLLHLGPGLGNGLANLHIVATSPGTPVSMRAPRDTTELARERPSPREAMASQQRPAAYSRFTPVGGLHSVKTPRAKGGGRKRGRKHRCGATRPQGIQHGRRR